MENLTKPPQPGNPDPAKASNVSLHQNPENAQEIHKAHCSPRMSQCEEHVLPACSICAGMPRIIQSCIKGHDTAFWSCRLPLCNDSNGHRMTWMFFSNHIYICIPLSSLSGYIRRCMMHAMYSCALEDWSCPPEIAVSNPMML